MQSQSPDEILEIKSETESTPLLASNQSTDPHELFKASILKAGDIFNRDNRHENIIFMDIFRLAKQLYDTAKNDPSYAKTNEDLIKAITEFLQKLLALSLAGSAAYFFWPAGEIAGNFYSNQTNISIQTVREIIKKMCAINGTLFNTALTGVTFNNMINKMKEYLTATQHVEDQLLKKKHGKELIAQIASGASSLVIGVSTASVNAFIAGQSGVPPWLVAVTFITGIGPNWQGAENLSIRELLKTPSLLEQAKQHLVDHLKNKRQAFLNLKNEEKMKNFNTIQGMLDASQGKTDEEKFTIILLAFLNFDDLKFPQESIDFLNKKSESLQKSNGFSKPKEETKDTAVEEKIIMETEEELTEEEKQSLTRWIGQSILKFNSLFAALGYDIDAFMAGKEVAEKIFPNGSFSNTTGAINFLLNFYANLGLLYKSGKEIGSNAFSDNQTPANIVTDKIKPLSIILAILAPFSGSVLGKVNYENISIPGLSEKEMQALKGSFEISGIFGATAVNSYYINQLVQDATVRLAKRYSNEDTKKLLAVDDEIQRIIKLFETMTLENFKEILAKIFDTKEGNDQCLSIEIRKIFHQKMSGENFGKLMLGEFGMERIQRYKGIIEQQANQVTSFFEEKKSKPIYDTTRHRGKKTSINDEDKLEGKTAKGPQSFCSLQ